MRTKQIEKQKACEMRSNGESIKQIARKLKVSPSSVLAWTKNIILTETQKSKLKMQGLA